MAIRSNGKQYIILFVENNAGVLARITSLFCQRGFNIDTLTVASTDTPAISRITISFFGDERTSKQLLMQTGKLTEVKAVIPTRTPFCVLRELLLVKLDAPEERREEILAFAAEYKFRVVDKSDGCMILELTGDPAYIDTLIEILGNFKILEMCHTGVTALERGQASFSAE